MDGTLCGVWVDGEGTARVSLARPDGGRDEGTLPFSPFAWLSAVPPDSPVSGVEFERLGGTAVLGTLARAASLEAFEGLLKAARNGVVADSIRPLESQFLIQHRARLYGEMGFSKLRRCQVDIETGSSDGGFSDAGSPGDRVLAIGMRSGGKNSLLLLDEMTDEAEKRLLLAVQQEPGGARPRRHRGPQHLQVRPGLPAPALPDAPRALRLGALWPAGHVPEQPAQGRRALDRLSRAATCPGRAVVDTYLLALLNDITRPGAQLLRAKGGRDPFRDHRGGGLGAHLHRGEPHRRGLREPTGPGSAPTWRTTCRETRAWPTSCCRPISSRRARFPIPLQEATLRGTTVKIDLLFLEEYYHARQSCPQPPEVRPFDGGYTRSFNEGVFRHVLHFDVASLYPSLLLNIGRNPANDIARGLHPAASGGSSSTG